jgi:hypothetical protein
MEGQSTPQTCRLIKTKEEIIEDLKDFLIFSTSFILSLFVIFAVIFSVFWSSTLIISIENRTMLELLKNVGILLVFSSPVITLIVYSLITKDWKINASLFALLLFLGINLIVLASHAMDLISMKELLQDNIVDKDRLIELKKAMHTKAFITSITISITIFSLVALILLIGEKIGKLLFSRKNKNQ